MATLDKQRLVEQKPIIDTSPDVKLKDVFSKYNIVGYSAAFAIGAATKDTLFSIAHTIVPYAKHNELLSNLLTLVIVIVLVFVLMMTILKPIVVVETNNR